MCQHIQFWLNWDNSNRHFTCLCVCALGNGWLGNPDVKNAQTGTSATMWGVLCDYIIIRIGNRVNSGESQTLTPVERFVKVKSQILAKESLLH